MMIKAYGDIDFCTGDHTNWGTEIWLNPNHIQKAQRSNGAGGFESLLWDLQGNLYLSKVPLQIIIESVPR